MTEPLPEEPLREVLGSLVAGQPAVADWPGQVRGVLRARRRRHAVALGAAAALVVGLGATALASADRDQRLVVAAPSPTSSEPSEGSAAPTPGATTEPASTTSPAPEPSPAPSPAEPDPSPSLAPSPNARPSHEPSPAAPSYPPFGTQDIEIVVSLPAAAPVAGQEWGFGFVVTGFADREPFVQGPRFDDEGPGFIVGACPPSPPGGESPPPAREQRVERTARHVFETPGRHVVEIVADSACSYYRGQANERFTVEVAPAP